MKRWETSEGGTPRATRYNVQVDIEYGVKGECTWAPGRSQNFSRSGILFSPSRTLPSETRLVIRVPMPLEGGRIVCEAKTVRQDAGQGTMAVAILKYRFEKRSSPAIK